MSDGIRTIYNEGRTVGLSAYELYVRKLLEDNPSVTPPSESAWLANMFGNGSAMILKINSGASEGMHDFELPSGSILCGANTLIATVFNGDCTWSDTAANSDTGSTGYWAQNVASYGGLIENNSESYPSSSGIPYGNHVFDSPAERQNILNYCKIAEGLVIQQGDWVENSATEAPYRDLKDPQFENTPAVIRLYIAKQLDNDVKILITGFLDSAFVQSLAGKGGSTNPADNGCDNGEFLGPAIFPWSSKIIFIYPNLANIYDDEYVRTVPQGTLDSITIGSYSLAGQNSDIEVSSMIDLNTTDPNTYYQVNSSKYGSSVIPINVTSEDTPRDGFNVLAVLEPGMTVEKANAAHSASEPDDYFFPPALYASKVTHTGVQNMVPVDTAAPGTVKVFTTTTEAATYPKQVPNSYAFYFDPNSGNLTFYNADGATGGGSISANLSTEKVSSGDSKAVRGIVTASGNTLKLVALSDANGNLYPTDGSSSTKTLTTSDVGFSWADLLDALANNKKIDVLGTILKTFRDNLPNINITGTITSGGSITSTSGDVQGANGKFTASTSAPTVKVGNANTSANGAFTYNNTTNQVECNKPLADSSGLAMGDYVSREGLTDTLTAGQTTIRLPATGTYSKFTNTSTSVYRVFTSKWGVNPTDVAPGNGYVQLTFRAQSQDLTVGALCYELKTT